MSSQEALKEHIVSLSVAKTFSEALSEWELAGIVLSEEMDECPCGQDIKELCYIKNKLNHNETYVGNVCIRRFMGIDTGTAFDGLKRIREDIHANPNADLIRHARKFGYLYPNEYDFLMQTRMKRNLSPAQLAWKEKINRRIINHIVVSKINKRPILPTATN